MKIEVNVSKKYFITLILSIFFVTSAVFVYAYGTSNPPVFGHDASELGPGRFSNTSGSDEWLFPGSVRIEGLGFDGAGSKAVFVGSDGNLFADDIVGPESEFGFSDEFIGDSSSLWDGSLTILDSEMNHPGLKSYSDHLYLKDALYSAQFFDITLVLKTPVNTGFKSSSFDSGNFGIGLFDGSTDRITFDTYETGYTARDNWLVITESAGLSTITKTNIPLTAQNNYVKLRILRKSQSEIEFYINDNLVATHTNNIPDKSLDFGTQSHTGTIIIDSAKLLIKDMNKRSLSCTQIYDSGATNVGATPGYASLNVPSACMASNGGCVIKQEIFGAGGVLKLSRSYTYKQESNGQWTGSSVSGRTYKNGDTSSANIMPSYSDSRILLRDDLTVTETAAGTWTTRDATSSYAHKLYSCTYV